MTQPRSETLSVSKHILVLSGAGLSAASGLSTSPTNYYAPNILRRRRPGEDQARVWQFYHYQHEIALKARTNAAHTAIAPLSIPAFREKVAPNADITQNIDGLSTCAYNDFLPETEQQTPPSLFEMHGRLFGKKPHRIPDIMALAERADLCIVVGTSSIVRPASRIAGIVKRNGGKIAVFNVDRSNHDDEADFLFLGPCEVLLPQVLNIPI
ncbi:DHS-like NAD/FAD-binding domain-containing protein [Mucidula mucida]|nr:DHS-like NAD/FAD-binding domain-containing protein [Mucidula mucida]